MLCELNGSASIIERLVRFLLRFPVFVDEFCMGASLLL